MPGAEVPIGVFQSPTDTGTRQFSYRAPSRAQSSRGKPGLPGADSGVDPKETQQRGLSVTSVPSAESSVRLFTVTTALCTGSGRET